MACAAACVGRRRVCVCVRVRAWLARVRAAATCVCPLLLRGACVSAAPAAAWGRALRTCCCGCTPTYAPACCMHINAECMRAFAALHSQHRHVGPAAALKCRAPRARVAPPACVRHVRSAAARTHLQAAAWPPSSSAVACGGRGSRKGVRARPRVSVSWEIVPLPSACPACLPASCSGARRLGAQARVHQGGRPLSICRTQHHRGPKPTMDPTKKMVRGGGGCSGRACSLRAGWDSHGGGRPFNAACPPLHPRR